MKIYINVFLLILDRIVVLFVMQVKFFYFDKILFSWKLIRDIKDRALNFDTKQNEAIYSHWMYAFTKPSFIF